MLHGTPYHWYGVHGTESKHHDTKYMTAKEAYLESRRETKDTIQEA